MKCGHKNQFEPIWFDDKKMRKRVKVGGSIGRSECPPHTPIVV